MYRVVELPESVSYEAGSSSFINPLTAILMLRAVNNAEIKAVVSTAASSSLGKMMVKFF